MSLLSVSSMMQHSAEPSSANGGSRPSSEAAALLQRGLDGLSSGVVLLDEHHRLLYVNPAMAALNAAPAAGQLGQRGAELRPDLAEQIEPVLRAVLEDGRPRTTIVRGASPDGSGGVGAWHVEYAAVDAEGGGRYCLGIVRDVTEEHDLVIRADRGEADRLQLRRVIEALNVFVAVLDVDGRVREANDNALRRSGLESDESILGVAFWRTGWFAWDPGETARVEAAFKRAAAGEPTQIEAVADMNLSPSRPTDAPRDLVPADCLFRRIDGVDGEEAFVLVSGYDITAHKRTLAATEAAVGERNAAVATRDRAIATVGHELRNPLAAASMAHELLAIDRDVTDDDERSATVATLGRSLTLMRRLVDDLMDYNRLTHDRVTIDRAPVDVLEVVRDAIADVAGSASGHPVECEADDPVVSGDAGRLRQVFANLLRNAARAVGGAVDDDAVDDRVRLRVARLGDRVQVEVIDDGCGFDPEAAARLFEPFRGGGGDDSGSGGLGLGLPLCRQIVLAHGGTIDAHSDGPGLGATFTVDLPASG